MKSRSKKRVSPKLKHGALDKKAPFWKGDTAEKIVAERIAQKKAAPKGKRKRGTPGPTDAHKTLRRLERALPRRKTLAGRMRVEQRIKDLKQELGIK